jgi:hypothetical protein
VKQKEKSSDIVVSSQPVSLRGQVTVRDIALFILETPGGHDQDIPFPDPGPFLHFSLNPSQTGDSVDALDTDVISTHHKLCPGKLLPVPFPGQAHTYGLDSLCAYFLNCNLIAVVLIGIIPNRIHSLALNKGRETRRKYGWMKKEGSGEDKTRECR